VRTPSPAALGGRLRLCALVAAVVVSSCTPSSVLSPTPKVDVGIRTSAVAAAAPPVRGLQSLVPSNPYLQSAPPRFDAPMSEPYSEQATMPADEIDCRRRLKQFGVTYRDLPTIDEGGACHIDWPVQVSGLPSGVALKPAATLTCQMALAFAAWTKDELVPSVRWRYFTGVKTIHQGSSYSCRKIAGTSTPSEHSKGNALDVMSIEFNSGRDIDVRKPGFFAFRQKKLLANVRKGGCDYFTTVLGPGYNADHANHFHFDIKSRRNGYVACR
jgi:hypothetical protein